MGRAFRFGTVRVMDVLPRVSFYMKGREQMRDFNKRFTKIIASIGPASSGENYPQVMRQGVDIFRFNFSHDTADAHKERFDQACAYEKELGLRFSKFADMQGPKHRIGVFRNDEKFLLTAGQAFRVDLDETPGDGTRVHLPHPEIFKSLRPGAEILINDGQIKLEVIESGDDYANTTVVIGGMISNKKGFNIPNVVIDAPCITEKDRKDIESAIEIGFKLIVISFVQTPEDVRQAKEIVGDRAKIISKLEKPAVMEHLDEIIALSDAIMIGRGDFAVEASYPIIPAHQKRIVWACRRQKKPVIVATQMLESMIDNPFPTRAEVSDIANACYEGADSTMLSAETTVGKNPDLAIRMMNDVIATCEAEENADVMAPCRSFSATFAEDDAELVTKVDALVKDGAKALVVAGASADVAGALSSLRLNIPVFAYVDNESDDQLFRLYYGVQPVLTEADVSAGAVSFKAEVAERLGVSESEVAAL